MIFTRTSERCGWCLAGGLINQHFRQRGPRGGMTWLSGRIEPYARRQGNEMHEIESSVVRLTRASGMELGPDGGGLSVLVN
jgi:hypothetical protein